EVYWLERFCPGGDPGRDDRVLATFFRRLERYGLGGKALLYTEDGQAAGPGGRHEFVGVTRAEAEGIFRRADLLLNFHYGIDPGLLSRFRRTAVVDIDPALRQFWASLRQVRPANAGVFL